MTDTNSTIEGKSNRARWFTAGVILLMIVLMVFSSNTVSRQSHMEHGVLVGTSNSGDVMSQDTRAASALIDQLSAVFVAVPSGAPNEPPRLLPLLVACWGDGIVRDLKAHPEALFLALREARRISPGVNPYSIGPIDPEQQQSEARGIFNSGRIDIDELRPLPASPLGGFRAQTGQDFAVELRVIRHTPDNHTSQVSPNTLPPLEQQALYGMLYDFLTIQSAASLPLNAIKTTSPMLDRMLSQRFQSFDLELAAVDARLLIAKVPEPTEEQLREQLAKYAAFIPGRISADNPFGFGYRVPDRVKLEIISVKRADIRRVVESEKSAYDWEVAARMALKMDPTLVKPTSQPTSQPAGSTPTEVPFESVKDLAIAATIDRATDQRAFDIEKAIRGPMALDYQAFSTATATRPGSTTVPSVVAPKSSLDVAYNTPDYLYRLADVIEKKFKVKSSVQLYTDKLRDITGLQQIGGFNNATRAVPPDLARRSGRPNELISGPEYAVKFAKDLLDPASIEFLGGLVLERYRPSERIESNRDEGRDREVFYFRITDAEANHPGTDIEPFREQLKLDYRVIEAQKFAVAEASKVVDAARAAPDFAAAVSQTIGGQTIRADVGPFHSAPKSDNGLGLSVPAYAQFGIQVTDKLLADNSLAVLDVPLAQKAYAAKRLSIQGDWTSESDLQSMRQYLRMQFGIQLTQPRSEVNAFGATDKDVAATWLDSKSILARFAYKPAKEEEKD